MKLKREKIVHALEQIIEEYKKLFKDLNIIFWEVETLCNQVSSMILCGVKDSIPRSKGCSLFDIGKLSFLNNKSALFN